MTTHFGIKLHKREGGFKLTADNYVKMSVEDIAGYYIMVLDKYCQIYIGVSSRGRGIKEGPPTLE